MPDPVLVVRSHQDAGLRAGPDGGVEGDGADAIHAALDEAGARLGAIAGEPAERLRARPAGEREGADMACYFDVRPPAGERPSEALLKRLRDVPSVEFAYVKGPVSLPVVPPAHMGAEPVEGPEPDGPPEDLRPRQGYLDPGTGVGASAVWERPGGRGD